MDRESFGALLTFVPFFLLLVLWWTARRQNRQAAAEYRQVGLENTRAVRENTEILKAILAKLEERDGWGRS